MFLVKDKKIVLNNIENLVIKLEESQKQIEEVVVTGYMNINKQAFTGSAITITKEELKSVSATNPLMALQSFDPSFRIMENIDMGSNPNALPEMYVRGRSGIGIPELDRTSVKNNPNLPTFILDGYEVSVSKIFDLDVDRIESITILKDAAATAIYGSRAANGVIVFTTVAVASGKLRVSYGLTTSFNTPDLSDYNLMNASEKIEVERLGGLYENDDPGIEVNLNKIYNQKLQNIERGVNTDWMALPLRNVLNHKHSIFVEGGSREFSFGLDLKYDRQNGVMEGSYRERMGLGFSAKYSFNNLRFRNYINITNVDSEESPYGAFSNIVRMNPYDTYLDEFGNVRSKMKNWGGELVSNPVYDASLGSFNKNNYKEFSNNFDLRWNITDNLNIKSSIAINYRKEGADIFKDPESLAFASVEKKGELQNIDRESFSWDMSTFLYYNNVIDKNYLNFAVGFNAKESTDEYVSVEYRGFPIGGYSSSEFAEELKNKPLSGYERTRLYGAILTANYTYDNIYLTDFSLRLDGSSEFGTKKKFATFWSSGLGINIHNYDYIKDNLVWLNRFKVRASYGITGKVNFPPYVAQNVYTILTDNWYSTGNSSRLQYMGNENLKWEKTIMTDIGGELSVFDDNIILNFNCYVKNTEDLIADAYVPSSSGFNIYKDNVGEVENKGYELFVRSKVIGAKKLQLYLFGSLASNKNKLVNISNSLKEYNERVKEYFDKRVGNYGVGQRPLLQYYEGASLTAIYGMKSLGISPSNGKELFLYKDGTTGYDWMASENVVIGDSEPSASGSLGFNLNWNGFTLDTYFLYEFGAQKYNYSLVSKMENADIRFNCDKRVLTERWQKPGDVVAYKDIKSWEIGTQPTSRFIQNYNVLTASSLSVGYEFPTKLLKMTKLKRLKLQFHVRDLFRISSVEQERGLSYPFARTFNFTLNTRF